ncbi:hypothetical protein LINPERHAP2_LOCUS19438 [Linum perenne]
MKISSLCQSVYDHLGYGRAS